MGNEQTNVIVIEGLDASGKETQSKLLSKEIKYRRVAFPNYSSWSSKLVRMYLNGKIDATPKQACWFYAIDRFFTLKLKPSFTRNKYRRVILDRYTTANMVHQISRLPREEWDDMLDYIEDIEYNKLNLPRPDRVLALIVPPEISKNNIHIRSQEEGKELDVLEQDDDFIDNSYEALLYVSEKYGWDIIHCNSSDTEMKSIEEIQEEILYTLGVTRSY